MKIEGPPKTTFTSGPSSSETNALGGIKISDEKHPPYLWANLQSEDGNKVEMTDLVFAHYFSKHDLRLILVVDFGPSSFRTISLDPQTGEKINADFPNIRTMNIYLVDKSSLSPEVSEKILQHRQQD